MREHQTTFVTPAQSYQAPQLPTVADSEPMHVETALQAQGGAHERTSATDRAKGLALRVAPFSVVWGVLSAGAVAALGADWWAGFLLFSGLTVCSYAWLDAQDWKHSRAGVERHRIDRAYQLKRIEMQSQAEARRAAIDTYRQLLLGERDREQ